MTSYWEINSTVTDQFHCPICMNTQNCANVSMCRLKCGHVSCMKCIMKWLKRSNTCAVCRTPVGVGRVPRPEPVENKDWEMDEQELAEIYQIMFGDGPQQARPRRRNRRRPSNNNRRR